MEKKKEIKKGLIKQVTSKLSMFREINRRLCLNDMCKVKRKPSMKIHEYCPKCQKMINELAEAEGIKTK